MASLTHVCMWSDRDKRWVRISAQEAARLHPGGTVSANSGLFRCELCQQYVTLTDGDVQVRHFRHKVYSDDCPEKVYGAGVRISYDSKQHQLPIRLRVLSYSSISLELGFIAVSEGSFSRKIRLEIVPVPFFGEKYIYSGERLSKDTTTYLPIGSFPAEKYEIKISEGSKELEFYWPGKVNGINPNGTVFDKKTGKKLDVDADVEVGRTYYLLKKKTKLTGSLYNSRHLRSICVCNIKNRYGEWYVYEITALDFDKSVANFFWDYRCRLTDHAARIQPVWPIYIENPYVIKINRVKTIIHVSGDARLHVFPEAKTTPYKCRDGELYVVDCNSRQQLISAGRSNALQYAYFWREPLDQTSVLPEAKVTDVDGNQVEQGVSESLPKKGILQVTLPYDGIAYVKKNGEILQKYRLKAGILTELDSIKGNYEVSVYVGADLAWSLTFKRGKKEQKVSNEAAILWRLQRLKGKERPIPHTAGSLATQLKGYHSVQSWLYQCIRCGKIDGRAYKELKVWITKEAGKQ